MANPTYLHIRGILTDNMTYKSRPGFESHLPRRQLNADPSFQLVLLDSADRVLVSVSPQVASRCARATDALRFSVRGSLPLHPKGAAYELRKDEITLYRASVAPVPPKAELAQCQTTDQGLALEWRALQGGTTYSVVAQMNSGRRITVARSLSRLAHTIDLREMPVQGEGKLIIVAHDGVRSSETEVASINVPERPPSVHIIAPAANARLPYGQPLSVHGTCLDMSGAPMPPEQAVWSIDGKVFASGFFIAALDQPEPGTHQLRLEYAGGHVETTIFIHIEEPSADYHEWTRLIGLPPP